MRWALENLPEDADVAPAIERFQAPVAELCDILPSISHGSLQAALQQSVQDLQAGGVPAEAAQRIAALRFLGDLMAVTRIAHEVGRAVAQVGSVYFALAEDIDFGLLLELLDMAPGEDEWEQRAAQGLMQDLGQARRNLTLAVLADGGKAEPVESQLANFRKKHAARLGNAREILEELLEAENINLAALTVATRETVRHSMAILEGRS